MITGMTTWHRTQRASISVHRATSIVALALMTLAVPAHAHTSPLVSLASATPTSHPSQETSQNTTQDTKKPTAPETDKPTSNAPSAPADNSKPATEKDGTSATTAKTAAEKPPTVPTDDNIVEAHAQKDLPTQRVVLFGESFDAELCLDQATRANGMGARDRFPAGTAMIFVHPRPIMLNYWMKDCFIDMDMIFVDGQGRVAAFYEATREPLRTKSETVERYESRLYRYSSRRPAQFVIEVPPGSIKRMKPALGQQIQLDWASLAKRAK